MPATLLNGRVVQVPDSDVLEQLLAAGVVRGDILGLALSPDIGVAVSTSSGDLSIGGDDLSVVLKVEEALRPRWTWWSNDTARDLLKSGVRVATCWDVSAAHRMLFGGWRADPARVWAQINKLPLDALPKIIPIDLFNYSLDDGDPEDPLTADGYLRPDWAEGGWSESSQRLLRWAELASKVALRQQAELLALGLGSRPTATARSESTAELLCAELCADGLPMDRDVAEGIVAEIAGPRPRNAAEAAENRARRDAEVLRHAPTDDHVDLRSPGQVRSLLKSVGFDLPDTRAWRLRELRSMHPLIEALLTWRKAERVATTYGYAWLDECLGEDGRLRGTWTGSDGAAGRMTASSGLHNMPAEMRRAVAAEDGHVFVRADLRQIEPRVLAAISGDTALAKAALADDLYAPIAKELSVDRETAKVAVLGAMYGQTTGDGARALRRLDAAYPVAMAYLSEADRSGQAGMDLRTYGGRLVKMGSPDLAQVGEAEARRITAARGRYGRNAVVQGAAAELFKIWAVTVRAAGAEDGVQIVLCLHDELLIHVPVADAGETERLVIDCLQQAVRYWAPDDSVRFVADVSVIDRWSDAKARVQTA